MRRCFSLLLIFSMLALSACGREAPPDIRTGESAPEASSDVEMVDAEPDDAEDGADFDPTPRTLRLTVPEGYTLARIGMTLEDMGVCTVEEFIDAAQQGDYSDFPLIAALAPDETRCFTLEGYLYPETYEIYADESPEQIIRRMLTHTERAFTPELRSQIEAYGMTVEEVVVLASIIQKEAFGDDVMPAISSVLHNRLGIGMQLQCDVTITYVEGAIKPFIDGDVNRYNEYYNTYKCSALPAGPICNPGMPAIRAAVTPMQSDYLYFVTDVDQNYYFTDDYDQHLDNVAAYLPA